MAKGKRAATVTSSPVCSIRGCGVEVGDSRRYCAEHLPRKLRDWEIKLIRDAWFVFGEPVKGGGYEVLGRFRSSTDAARFMTETNEAGEYGYELNELRSVWYLHDENAMADGNTRVAIERWLDAAEKGEQDMATVKQAKAKAAKATTNGTRAPRVRTPQRCECGCGGMTGGGKFLPGHDAKLKGQLQTAYREAAKAGRKADMNAAAKQLTDRGWSKYIPDLTKDAAKAAKAKERLAAVKEKAAAKKAS